MYNVTGDGDPNLRVTMYLPSPSGGLPRVTGQQCLEDVRGEMIGAAGVDHEHRTHRGLLKDWSGHDICPYIPDGFMSS